MRYRTGFSLAGPFITWALCFLTLYAVQFVGCAWGGIRAPGPVFRSFDPYCLLCSAYRFSCLCCG